MKQKKLVIVTLPLFFFFICGARSTYEKTVLQPISDNVLSLLHETVTVKFDNNLYLPPDITFFFADVKYTGQECNICEFGGMSTGNMSTVIINGKPERLMAPYWDLFWHYLAQFKKPIWYVGDAMLTTIKELPQVGGQSFSSLRDFLKYYTKNFPVRAKKSKTQAYKKITDYSGILVIKNQVDPKKVKRLLKEYPEVLVVNAYTRKFTGKHHLLSFMEKNHEWDTIMPRWKVYEKKYTSQLAQQIMQDIPADFYIIKPMLGILSKGVLMVAKSELDFYLELLLHRQEAIDAKDYPHLAYWKKDRSDSFFVQAYAPSKEIMCEGKNYDPTMRVVFFLHHEHKVVKLNVIAGFWKIPPHALEDEVPLTEKHITRPFIGSFFTGIAVDPDDFKQVKQHLISILPSLYFKMLACQCRG